ncbi:MAG: DUF302 domain-containing protein [Vannielia sp.]|uniref:DUF302 domain-containing protein n=1 Tax=Vannielia sp. TaxID=2813045 RepID=UPI003B8B4C04
MKPFGLALTLTLLAAPALAEPPITYPYEGSFADATFAVENAIIGQGLVVDHTSHVGEMLARTGSDLGATKEIFEAADVFLFCSATLSREVMEADPLNIQHCPYAIFVTQIDGKVQIGHRDYPEGPMEAVEQLLKTIATEATAF